MQTEKLLSELVNRLSEAYGRDLLAVVLFGSAATGDFHQGHSDLNVLCVLRAMDLDMLERSERTANWWRAQGNPAPLLIAESELSRATDAFPIEFLDIREQHRVLFGEDVVAGVLIDAAYHRVQVEHELRAKLIALRQRYLGIHRDKKAVLKLVVDALPSFTALFRHSLILAGEPPPVKKRDVVEAAGRRFGFDPAPFLAVLELREGARKRTRMDVRSTFQAYYAGIARVCEQVDLLQQKAEIR